MKKQIAVIGLGYVGLPIALEFAKKVPVIGFDIKNERVELMKKQIDPSNELVKEDFDNTTSKGTGTPVSLDICFARLSGLFFVLPILKTSFSKQLFVSA